MVKLLKLQAEIISDPNNRGYAAMSDYEVLTRVKTRRHADVHIIRATEILPLNIDNIPEDLTPVINTIIANGGDVSQERTILRNRLRSVFGGTSTDQTNGLVCLVRQHVSIAEELRIGQDVTLADIQAVRAT